MVFYTIPLGIIEALDKVGLSAFQFSNSRRVFSDYFKCNRIEFCRLIPIFIEAFNDNILTGCSRLEIHVACADWVLLYYCTCVLAYLIIVCFLFFSAFTSQ